MSKHQSTAAELGLGMDTGLPAEQRVDFSNWTLPPYNRWAFQHVQQLTRTGRIARSATPLALRSSPVDVGTVKYIGVDHQEKTVATLLDESWLDGFLVMHRGQIAYERYFNGMQADSLHLMMSCSKSLTSSLVGIAVEAGDLDTAAMVIDYIPELRDSPFAGTSVQNVLDMRVGVRFDEDYDDLNGHWRDLEVATGWREPDANYSGPFDMLSYMQTLSERERSHGSAFHYQSILTDVLGVCLERATGESFLDAFAKRIWQPLGTEHDLVTIIDSAGFAVFEGGFNCTLRDFARFAWMIANGGRSESGIQIVPENWINRCRFPGPDLCDAFAASEYGEVFAGFAYHNKWWVSDPERGVISALGIHGQGLYIDPEQETIIARFASEPAHVNLDLATEQLRAFDAIAEQL